MFLGLRLETWLLLLVTAGNALKWIDDWVHRQDATTTHLTERMDRAGKLMSDLASQVQGMEDVIERRFMTRRESDILTQESYVDRQRLQRELEAIRSELHRRPR